MPFGDSLDAVADRAGAVQREEVRGVAQDRDLITGLIGGQAPPPDLLEIGGSQGFVGHEGILGSRAPAHTRRPPAARSTRPTARTVFIRPALDNLANLPY